MSGSPQEPPVDDLALARQRIAELETEYAILKEMHTRQIRRITELEAQVAEAQG